MLIEIIIFLYCWATIFIILSLIKIYVDDTMYIYYKFITSPEFNEQALKYYNNKVNSMRNNKL